jgi:hypothetical protein
MSLSAAINAAVWAQLSTDGKPLPDTGQEVMGTDYRYDPVGMRNFLHGVARRLQADTPPLTFQWHTLDLDTCLSDSVIALCGYIATATA